MSTRAGRFSRVFLARPVLAMILGVVLAGMPVTQAAAYASAPNPGDFLALTTDRSNPDVVTFTLTADTAVGDCVALSGGTLQVPRPSASGLTYVAWTQRAYTQKTKNYDQWHSELTLLGADGGSYLVPTRVDSDKMSTAWQVYGWTKHSIVFPMTSAFYAQINGVQWVAYC
ncbi:hypothetical protein GCM10020358_64280 [Amorphoplanes nipponensis]|uniref:Uncharacterized protein n=1 Tax=Actinoplanes nipponensis TaxID=135950 RepID=A0A919JMY2_9ACTN|nr:hypothetical protein [Actinoplanes nipponensis]GIE52167.1 hypothetical protein Ani05nite_57010 [Actinoplanes nipponensis]